MDMQALGRSPQWAQANYWASKGRDNQWYATVDPGCVGSRPDNTACHEFPYFSTQQVGLGQDPETWLKQISASDNGFEGSKLGRLYKACDMASGTVPAGGTVAVGGDAFIIAPVGSSLPTTYLCNGKSTVGSPTSQPWGGA